MERLITHRLRHSFATSLMNGGMGLMGIMKLLGHRDYRMTLRCNQIVDETVGREYFASNRPERTSKSFARRRPHLFVDRNQVPHREAPAGHLHPREIGHVIYVSSDIGHCSGAMGRKEDGASFAHAPEHEGTATPIFLDTHVVGCHVAGGSECSATQARFADDNRMVYVAGSGAYTAKVVPDSTTCADVRAALPIE